METRSNDLLVGVFVIVFVIMTVGVTLWLSETGLDQESQPYRLFVERAPSGLAIGSSVRFLGVPTGSVSQVGIDPETRARVLVRIEVPRDIPVREDSVATIESAGLTGGVFVQISPGSPESPLLTDISEDEAPVIETRASGLSAILDSAPDLFDSLLALSERANALLSDQNIDSVTSSLQEIEAAASGLSRITGQAEQITAQIQVAIVDAQGAVQAATQMIETYDRLGRDTGDGVARVLTRAVDALETVEAETGRIGATVTVTADELQQTAAAITALSNEINGLVGEARPGVRDFAGNGLYELSFLFAELRLLVNNLTVLVNQIEQDPSQFLFGRSGGGVAVE